MKKLIFLLMLTNSLLAQVGINTTTPTSTLDVNGQVTIDQKNFGGYGGLLIKGDQPGNNYPNVAFSILNDTGTDEIAGYIGGNINNNTTGSESMDLSFLTSTNGQAGLTEKMRITDNGNVGIGNINPNFILDVSNRMRIRSSGSIFSSAGHWLNNSTNTYLASFIGMDENENVGFYGNTGSGWGFVMKTDTGNVGIGNQNPTEKLDIAGKIKITDGTQAADRVLTSDANGVGSWRPIGINNISVTLSAGVDVPYTTANFLQTGTSITLPNGRYAVNVTMLLTNPTNSVTPANSSIWIRSTFSDSSAANPLPSSNIEGSPLISGNLTGSSVFSIMNGTIIINNNSGANKTYYYVAGRVIPINTTDTIIAIGGSLGENNIIAYKLQ